MPSPSKSKPLASWDSTRQQQYRTQHADETWTFHFLLDASPSMLGTNAENLKRSFNQYLAWLQAQADPMSLAQVRCFSTALGTSAPQPLGTLKPLTDATYNPREGDGTALYYAIGHTCSTTPDTGQHILVVFTDGYDNRSDEYQWTPERVKTVLQTLQEHQGWLCVFLGAVPDALAIGQAMGFLPGNCLAFSSDRIPEAFHKLRAATQKYLAAAPETRKLLTAGGVF